MKPQHIVILGGGFAGLTAALKLRKLRERVQVTIVDRTNHNLFQPLLYQVSNGTLSPNEIAIPFRQFIPKNCNLEAIIGAAQRIDRATKTVHLEDGSSLSYDKLLVCVGTKPAYFGHPEWEAHAPGLKNLNDALRIREKFFLSTEIASRIPNPADRKHLLTVVIVGAGPTGVELAGSMSEILHKSLRSDFRNLSTDELRIVLVEGGDRVLGTFHPKLSERAKADLERLGVEVRLNTFVKNVTAEGVQVGEEWIPTVNAIWAAGNAAEDVLASLGTEQDRMGRVRVTPHLHLPGDPNVFVLGDAAHALGADGKPLPGVAQVALQQGKYLAKAIASGKPMNSLPAFAYKNLGNMATIGRAKAVVEMPSGGRITGLLAWLMWAVVHVFKLVEGRDRWRVLSEWSWFYITFSPGARLLYGYGKNAPAFAQQAVAQLRPTPEAAPVG